MEYWTKVFGEPTPGYSKVLFAGEDAPAEEEDAAAAEGAEEVPSSLMLSSLALSDTIIYEPEIRALLVTAPHFCSVVG